MIARSWMVQFAWAFFLPVLAVGSWAGEVRTWRSGQYQIEGEFAKCQNGQVTIRRADANADGNQEITVRLQVLSKADQEFVKQAMADSRPSAAKKGSESRSALSGKPLQKPTASSGAAAALPELVVYPCQTAIEAVPWTGVVPAGLPKGTWKVVSAPQGLEVDPNTGQAKWKNPVAGFHSVAVNVSDRQKTWPAEWYLLVVKNDIPDAKIYSTRYLDFVVPAKFADRANQYNLAPVMDAVWGHMRDCYGLSPDRGKQVIKYAPEMGGGAHSGNPVMMGPGWFKDDPVECWGWMLHIPVHEFGHDFHGMTNIGPIISGKNPSLDRFFHHGMEITESSVMARVAENPKQYHLEGPALATYLEYHKRELERNQRRADPFRKWIGAGNDPAKFEGDAYGVGETMCCELCRQCGPQALEQTIRLFCPDALAQSIYNSADTDIKRQTLLCCMFSAAAGRDQKAYFKSWAFKLDERFFDETFPAVKETLAQLPPADVAGWSHCPKNAKLYRLTPWRSGFWAAETAAMGVGGHLAAVRNAEEFAWLARRYVGHGDLWIGISDEASEGVWRRLDGTASPFAMWAEGQPSGGRAKNAAVIRFSPNGPRWVTAEQTKQYLGIIEIPVPVEKTSPRKK